MRISELWQFRPAEPLLFSTGLFFILFAGFYALYLALQSRQRLRLLWVLAFSCYFYYKCSGPFLSLLMSLALMDYLLAARIHAEHTPWKRRLWLCLSLGGNLGALFYFK